VEAVKSRLTTTTWFWSIAPLTSGSSHWNGLRISQGYVIPKVPDYLSTYGIPRCDPR